MGTKELGILTAQTLRECVDNNVCLTVREERLVVVLFSLDGLTSWALKWMGTLTPAFQLRKDSSGTDCVFLFQTL